MRRDDLCLYLGPADRAQLQALLTDRNTPRKIVWRAEIVLATADGFGTNEIMRRAATSKPTVWRWQQRYLDEGVAGLKRDKTRPSRVPPLSQETRLAVIGGEPLGKRFIEWNFVSSRKERIEEAKKDWQNGRFPVVPGDESDYIPLPE